MDLVISDLHEPYGHAAAKKALLHQVRGQRMQAVWILGDLLDLEGFSSHKNSKPSPIMEEIEQARRFVDQLVSHVGAETVYFMEGNHEHRLTKWFRSKLPQYVGPNLKRLLWGPVFRRPPYRVRYYPYGQVFERHGLHMVHGHLAKKGAGASALSTIAQYGVSCIVGHSHRMAAVAITQLGRVLRGWENGCLCKFNLPWLQSKPDWQHGYSLVDWGKRAGYAIRQVLIN